jgi:hypothetical protein
MDESKQTEHVEPSLIKLKLSRSNICTGVGGAILAAGFLQMTSLYKIVMPIIWLLHAHLTIVLPVLAVVAVVYTIIRLKWFGLLAVVAATAFFGFFWYLFPGFVKYEDGTIISMSAVALTEIGIVLISFCQAINSPPKSDASKSDASKTETFFVLLGVLNFALMGATFIWGFGMHIVNRDSMDRANALYRQQINEAGNLVTDPVSLGKTGTINSPDGKFFCEIRFAKRPDAHCVPISAE